MNHRPIVLPGIISGVVLLAAMVGFVKLPSEGTAAAAAPASSDADISMCRSLGANAAAVEIDSVFASEDANTVLTSMQNLLGSVQQSVTDPSLSKTVQRPLSEFFAVGVRTYNGIAKNQKVDAEQMADLKKAYTDVVNTCSTVDA